MNIDRRTLSRYDMQLVCHAGPGRVISEPVAGVVENISRGGMLMRWDETVPVPDAGSSLVVEVILPENTEFGPRIMRCRTRVVRIVSRTGRRALVALKIDQIRFVQKASKPSKMSVLAMPS